jgi:hypothetical protein
MVCTHARSVDLGIQGIKAIPSEHACLKYIVTPSDHDLGKYGD